jgi:hypothetical protein
MKRLAILGLSLAVFGSLSNAEEDTVTLHPDFPVVSGDYQLSSRWTITLSKEMNRRLEDRDLVLWRTGITVWMSLWNNDRGETVRERLGWLQSDASPEAFDISVEANSTPARYSYRLNEQREDGVVFALYGFALKDDGHLQIAIYVDQEVDLADARALLSSVR